MATEAQLRAIKKWSTEKVDEIKIRVPKGQKRMRHREPSNKLDLVLGVSFSWNFQRRMVSAWP